MNIYKLKILLLNYRTFFSISIYFFQSRYFGFGLQMRPALVTYGAVERTFVECSVSGFFSIPCGLRCSLTSCGVGNSCLDSAEGVWTKGSDISLWSNFCGGGSATGRICFRFRYSSFNFHQIWSWFITELFDESDSVVAFGCCKSHYVSL